MAKTNDEIFSLRSLAMDRAQARENLKIDTAATRERLKPSSLVSEARNKATQKVGKAGQKATEGLKAHPVITATVAATAAMIAMRRPIARLIASQKKSQPDQSQPDQIKE
ncbi:MAG: hypothetical protein V7671_09535 [Parasphingorhabdus flavimaris]